MEMTLLIILSFAVVTVITVVYFLGRLNRACIGANEVDWGSNWLNRLDGAIRLLCRKYHRLTHQPIFLPPHGPGIVVANHISGLDALLLIASVKRPLRFLIAREQYERFGLHWILRSAGCIPVDRENRPERAYRLALKALATGEVVAVFPHGGIQWPVDAHNRLKPGAVMLSQRSGIPIFPFYISGVRGSGKNLSAILIRSRVDIHTHEPIDFAGVEVHEAQKRLAQILNR